MMILFKFNLFLDMRFIIKIVFVNLTINSPIYLMKLRYLTLFFALSLTCSCFAQDRFLESDVVMDHDTMFLKKEMHKITA